MQTIKKDSLQRVFNVLMEDKMTSPTGLHTHTHTEREKERERETFEQR